MHRSKRFLRWLSGWLLLCVLGVGLLGGAGLSARAAPVQQAPLSVVINEIAWAGTQQSPDDDWIELFNPSTSNPVDISDWELISNTFSITFPASPPTVIPPNGYFLIERREQATTIPADQTEQNLLLGDNGDYLRLRDSSGTLVDSANSFNTSGGPWPAGNKATATMQRGRLVPDSNLAWITYESSDPLAGTEFDAGGKVILGTPRRSNWPVDVLATLTFTPTVTSTPTVTPTRTVTATGTMTQTPTRTATPFGVLSIVINEVAWAGTGSGNLSVDEWLELYNPTSVDIDISNWVLDGNSFRITFPNNTVITTNDRFFLIEAHEDVTNVASDLIANDLILNDTNERLYLFDDRGVIVDRANFNGGPWPAGDATSFSTMERGIIAEDSNFVWVTYDVRRDAGTKARNAVGNDIRGTPGRANISINLTPTVTPSPRVPGIPPRVTAVPPLPPILGISEFLPRPGHDWNNDGVVDVFDEFIEIINAGRIDVNLSAYRLDDEQSLGSVPFTLPNITLKPDERIVFYASETGILLSDAGDTVRLLRGNTVVDAYTYPVVRYPDQSWCRIPDRLGYWNDPCFPTPNNANALTGTIPLPARPAPGIQPRVCLLPDTTPDVFVYAECEVGGAGIWNRQFWDAPDAAEHLILNKEQKWETVFE